MAHLLAAQTNPLNDGPGCIKAAKTHLDAIAADDPEYPKLDKLRRQLVEVEVKVKKVTDPIDQEFGTVEARQFAHRRMQMRERKRKSK